MGIFGAGKKLLSIHEAIIIPREKNCLVGLPLYITMACNNALLGTVLSYLKDDI